MIIRGTGCCLIDYLYSKVDFSSPSFVNARSHSEGDGGLVPGQLVFAEDFQRFSGKPYENALRELTGGSEADSCNLGGPSAVSLAHTAQLLQDKHEVHFYGVRGQDHTGDLMEALLAKLPFTSTQLLNRSGFTPRTDVLCDPAYDGGHGERTFINSIGAANNLYLEDLSESFYQADLVVFGGTALVPALHDKLTSLLAKAKNRKAITMVNLVYDFRSELLRPGEKWRLGVGDDAYPNIDILIADRDEALKTSGTDKMEDAVAYFLSRGTGTVLITHGARNLVMASSGKLFASLDISSMPVCAAVNEELKAHPKRRGDTTGCGDNFAGGFLANTVEQIAAGGRMSKLDLKDACAWAVASGAFTCFITGGTYYEKQPGEKRKLILPYLDSYRRQTFLAMKSQELVVPKIRGNAGIQGVKGHRATKDHIG